MRSNGAFRFFAAMIVAVFALIAAANVSAEDKIGAKVGKPMKAAQEAIQKQDWDKALAKVQEADAVAKKNEFEQYQINEFKGYILLQKRQYAEVARIYEQNLKSPKMPADQVNDRLKALAQLYSAVKNYPKVIEYGDRWVQADGTDLDTKVLVAQAHYLQKDYKNAVTIMQSAIAAAEKAGKKPEENWLQIVRSSQQNLGDTKGASATLEKLVTIYPKKDYWDYLISLRLREKNPDRVTLNLLRISREVGLMDTADEFVELTEMLIDAGLPGEARSVMEQGYKAGVFDTTDKTKAGRYARRLNDAKIKAEKDQASLPSFERDAKSAGTGQGEVALGMAYSSFGQYEKSAAALARGLDKGGVLDAGQARIMLGIANLKLGKTEDALQAFSKAATDDAELKDVARLWSAVARSGV
jgi:tetratricopeptide (TPR) repeat protein